MRPATLRELRAELETRTARLESHAAERTQARESGDQDRLRLHNYRMNQARAEVQTIVDAIENLSAIYDKLPLGPRECFAKVIRFTPDESATNRSINAHYPGHTITRVSHRGQGGMSGRIHYRCECGWSHTFEPQERATHTAAYNHILTAYRANLAQTMAHAEKIAQEAQVEVPSPFTEEGQTRELTREHIELHVAICQRFEKLQNQNQLDTKGISHRNPYGDRMSRMMDLEAVHQELDMDWQALLGAKDGDFMHDVGGIHSHMDRSTAILGGCFLPRFTRPAGPPCDTCWFETPCTYQDQGPDCPHYTKSKDHMSNHAELLPANTVVSWTDEAGARCEGAVVCLAPLCPQNDDGSPAAELATYRVQIFQTLHGQRVRAGYAYKRVQHLTVEVPLVTVAELEEHEDVGGAL